MTVRIEHAGGTEVVECAWARVIEASGCFLMGFLYPNQPHEDATYTGRAYAPGTWEKVIADSPDSLRIWLNGAP